MEENAFTADSFQAVAVQPRLNVSLSAEEERAVATRAHALLDEVCAMLGDTGALREALRTCSDTGALRDALAAAPPTVAQEARKLSDQADQLYWQLALSGARVIHFEARRLRLYKAHRFDLEQLGHVGLFNAARRFDPGRGLRFSTFARWRVRAELQEALQRYGRLVRLPSSAAELRKRVERARADHHERGLPTDDHTIAEVLGVRVSSVRRVSCLRGGCSLDDEVDGVSLHNLLAAEGVSCEEALIEQQRSRQCRAACDDLDEREREILSRHFGLDGSKPETLTAIGKGFSLSRERIRQLEKLALRTLAAKID